MEAAIACNLAAGMSMIKAVKKANLYVEAGIKTSVKIGKGSGPINHFHSTYTLPFTQQVISCRLLHGLLTAPEASSSHTCWTEKTFNDHGNSTPSMSLCNAWAMAPYRWRISGTT